MVGQFCFSMFIHSKTYRTHDIFVLDFHKDFLIWHIGCGSNFKSFVDPQMEWLCSTLFVFPKRSGGCPILTHPWQFHRSTYDFRPVLYVYVVIPPHTHIHIYAHMQIVSDVKSWVNSISLCAVLRIDDKLYYIYNYIYDIWFIYYIYKSYIIYIYIFTPYIYIYHLHQQDYIYIYL
jgi:hypothetical protein